MLVVCDGCRRHIRDSEASCPFCATGAVRRRGPAASVFHALGGVVTTVVLAACYGPPSDGWDTADTADTGEDTGQDSGMETGLETDDSGLDTDTDTNVDTGPDSTEDSGLDTALEVRLADPEPMPPIIDDPILDDDRLVCLPDDDGVALP